MKTTLRTGATVLAVVGVSLMLQGCLVGAVVGAGVDAVTTSDEETKARREREQRQHEREQRRCEQRQRQGRDC